jgi:LAO/AO transport system kinase
VSLADAVLAGDRRAAARLLSRAEAGDTAITGDLRALYLAGGRAKVIGVTGPPGAGKSTLVDRLVALLRAAGERVAVVAVDPSSPFTGGAVLGDRVRMSRHAEDDGVFIRSMAARGALGGLAPATGDAVTILDAMGFDTIIIETVGVGQSEIDILSHAETVILLQTAHGGDGVQMVKAGILEIADILVVNKGDAPGTDKMLRGLSEMVAHAAARPDGWTPPVLKTAAVNGDGVAELAGAITDFYNHRAAHPAADEARRTRQVRARVLALTEAMLRRRLFRGDEGGLDSEIAAIVARKSDPHDLADRLARGKLQ